MIDPLTKYSTSPAGMVKSHEYRDDMKDIRKYKNKESVEITVLDDDYSCGEVL